MWPGKFWGGNLQQWGITLMVSGSNFLDCHPLVAAPFGVMFDWLCVINISSHNRTIPPSVNIKE